MDTLERFAAGEVDAFETVFRQYPGESVQMDRPPGAESGSGRGIDCRKILAHRNRKRFDARRPFGPWARRIATRVSIDHLRSTDSREFPPELLQPAPEKSTAQDTARKSKSGIKYPALSSRSPAKLCVAASLALIEECP